jgi:hypothetical protein
VAKSPVSIKTKVPLRNTDQLFRRAMRVSWISENITGSGTKFGKPPSDAFDDLDHDPPQLAVMAILGGRGLDVQGSAVHMAAWQRDGYTEIQMLVGKNLGAFGLKAKSKMRGFLASLRAEDPATECVGM